MYMNITSSSLKEMARASPTGAMWMATSWVWLTRGSWKWSIMSLCSQGLSWVRSLELLCLYPYCFLRAEPVHPMDFTGGETEAHSRAVMCPRTLGKTPCQSGRSHSGLSSGFPALCVPLCWLLQQQRRKERSGGWCVPNRDLMTIQRTNKIQPFFAFIRL